MLTTFHGDNRRYNKAPYRLVVPVKSSKSRSYVLSLLLRAFLVGSLVSLFWLVLVEPAQAAIFLFGAESYAKKVFTDAATQISLVFGVIRVVVTLGCGVCAVSAAWNYNQGNEWQTLAKIPVIILGVVFFLDAIVKIITGE